MSLPTTAESPAGSINFRDIGGHTAAGGVVRTGRVYRSGFTHSLTPDGLTLLTERLHVRTVIDLRSGEEALKNRAPWEAFGVRHISVPVTEFQDATSMQKVKALAQIMRGTYDWTAFYQHLTRTGGGQFALAFNELAAAVDLPVVIHCTAGRDRTGITVALLLDVLGVAHDQIATDYAQTERHLLANKARFAQEAGLPRLLKGQAHKFIGTPPETMRRFLSWVQTEHGSAERYLLQQGTAPAAIATLRSALVEPT